VVRFSERILYGPSYLVPRLGFKKLAASLETCSTTTRKRHGPLAMGYLLRHKSGFTASP